MKELKPYLIFTGNCQEALQFYAACFGGEITFMKTFADSPLNIPKEYEDRIFNSELRADNLCFMASDNVPPYATETGSNVCLFVAFSDHEEQKRVFDTLSRSGKVIMPFENGFGMAEDKYGFRWMLAGR